MRALLLAGVLPALILGPARAQGDAPERLARARAALAGDEREDRWAGAWEAGELGPAAAPLAPSLAALLLDPDPELRWVAARALGRVGPAAAEHAPALCAALADADDDVRWAAARALGQVGAGTDAVRAALAEALDDPAEPVAAAAAVAAGRVGAEELRARLEERLDGAAAPVAAGAAEGLGALGSGPSESRLADAWRRGPPALRRAAAGALGRAPIADPALLDELRDALAGADGATAAVALAGTPDEASARALRAVAASDDERLAQVAVRALGAMAERAVDEVLRLRAPDAPGSARVGVGRARAVLREAREAALARRAEDPRPARELVRASARLDAALAEPAPPPVPAAPRDTSPRDGHADATGDPTHPPERASTPAVEPRRDAGGPDGRAARLAALVLLLLLAPAVAIGLAWVVWPDRLLPFLARAESDPRLAPVAILGGLRRWAATRRAVDAWLAPRVATARRAFADHPAVRARRLTVPVGVRIDGEAPRELVPAALGARLGPRGFALRVRGDVGTGRRTVALELAAAALASEPAERLGAHLRLPAILDRAPEARDRAAWLELAAGEVAALLGQPVPVVVARALHDAGRLLFVFSELSILQPGAHDALESCARGLPRAGAIVVATRGEPSARADVDVSTERLSGAALAVFLDRILRKLHAEWALEPDVFFDACRSLVAICRGRPVSAVWARTFAEGVAARPGEPVPSTRLELVRRHVELRFGRGTRRRERDARRVAAAAVRGAFRAAPFSRARALRALDGDESRLAALFAGDPPILRERADGLLRFDREPIAEAFAAWEIALEAGDDPRAWDAVLEALRRTPGAPASVERTARALAEIGAELCDREVLSRGPAGAATRAIERWLDGAHSEPQPRSQERRALELARALEEGGPDRAGAARELARLGPAAALCAERVAACLADDDPDVRSAVAGALAALGAEAASGWVVALRDLSPVGRRAALELLAELGPGAATTLDEVAPLVLEPDLRAAAARTLAAFGPDAAPAVSALLEALEATRPEDARDRVAILGALGAVGPAAAAAVPALVAALHRPVERTAAIEALARLGRAGDAAAPVLERLLAGDPSASAGLDALVRASAAAALGHVGSVDSKEALVRALEDDNEVVRSEARSALDRLGQGPSVATSS